MLKLFVFATIALLALVGGNVYGQSENGGVVAFVEPGFPAADSGAPSSQQTAALFSTAIISDANHLADELGMPSTRLLVLPYGSAFPEDCWPAIRQFLGRGGNLLVLGGQPFSRAAYHDLQVMHLRD